MWTLNNTYLWADFSAPTNLLISENDTVHFPPHYEAYYTPDTPDAWMYIVFNDISERNRSHPMHLHGHDFFLLGIGDGNYSKDSPLNLENPPRRDTATWPERGYMVLAFKTDNPGTWLLHCHIAWHSSQGLGLQIIERPEDIEISSPQKEMNRRMCQAWDKYWKNPDTNIQEDSGI